MVLLIREHLKIVFSRQKSYADPRKKDVEFAVGDHILKGLFYERSYEIWKER